MYVCVPIYTYIYELHSGYTADLEVQWPVRQQLQPQIDRVRLGILGNTATALSAATITAAVQRCGCLACPSSSCVANAGQVNAR